MSSFAECSVIKPPASEQAIGPVTAANDALLRDFAIRAVKAQSFGYLRAVLGGLALSVEWPRHPYPDPGTVYSTTSTGRRIPSRSTTPG